MIANLAAWGLSRETRCASSIEGDILKRYSHSAVPVYKLVQEEAVAQGTQERHMLK